jgi:uncharacterized protein with PIN domain
VIFREPGADDLISRLEQAETRRMSTGSRIELALADQTGLPVLCTGDDFVAAGLDVVRSRRARPGS